MSVTLMGKILIYAYYICSRHAATKACAAHRIPMGKLEETVLELVKIHIENILDMKKIMDFIHEVPFQELDIKELEIRKEAKENSTAESCYFAAAGGC